MRRGRRSGADRQLEPHLRLEGGAPQDPLCGTPSEILVDGFGIPMGIRITNSSPP